MPLHKATINHLSEVAKSVEKTTLNFKFSVTDKFGIYLD